MQILNDLYNETKRLFIAGSKFAKDDPRIAKYIPALEKMGEKAPVLKKLAEKYTALVKDGQSDSLADAGTFLYAVMATQGASEVIGESMELISNINELPKTKTPYSQLKPILDALTISAQGRYEVIKNAYEKELLNDFRLYKPLVAGLDDKYSMLSDYIYTTVIPEIGTLLIPYLLEQYNKEGKQGDAMRLSLLFKLGYENVWQLAFEAIENGSTITAVSGIKILGADKKNEEYLLMLASDKKSAIREEALISLIRMDSAKGKELMMKTLNGSKYKSAIEAAKLCTDTEYAHKLLELVKPYYNNLSEKELPDNEFLEANNKFTDLFETLIQKDKAEICEFYKDILKNETYLKRLHEYKGHSYQLNDAQRITCNHLLQLPDDKLINVCEDALTALVVKKSSELIKRYYHAAKKQYQPEYMFDTFSKYYKAGVLSFNEMFCPDVSSTSNWNEIKDMEKEFEQIRSNINTHWKKLFIANGDLFAMRVLFCKGDEYEKDMKDVILKKAKEYIGKKRLEPVLGLSIGRLVEVTKNKKTVLFKSEFDKIAEVCYELFDKTDGYSVEYFYDSIGEENFLKLFYPEYTEKFKVLAGKKTARIYVKINELLQSKN